MYTPSNEPINPGGDTSIATIHAPIHCSVTTDGADLLIHRRWGRYAGLKNLVAALFVIGIIAYFFQSPGSRQVFASGSSAKDALALGILYAIFLAAGLYFLVIGLYQVVDSTTVRVNTSSVSTLHHPLPWRTKEFSSTEIKQVFVTSRRASGDLSNWGGNQSVGSRSNYSVDLLMSDGKKATLLSQLPRADQAQFVEAQIERQLGIKNAHVKGEAKI